MCGGVRVRSRLVATGRQSRGSGTSFGMAHVPLLPSGHPGSARMKLCVGTLAAAIGTGITHELRDCDIVGAGCSTWLGLGLGLGLGLAT